MTSATTSTTTNRTNGNNRSNQSLRWKRVWGCTPESMALFRILLGLLLSCELVLRFRFLHAFYTDQGTLPSRFLWPQIDGLYKIVCIHCWSGSLWYQQMLLGVQVVVAILFTLGVLPRTTATISWLFYFSLTLRNTWLNFILDRYLQHLLWYAIFLPTGRCYTFRECRRFRRRRHVQDDNNDNATTTMTNARNGNNDNHNDDDDDDDRIILTLATIVIKLQALWIYVDAGFGKLLDPLGGWTWHPTNDMLPALDSYCRHTVGARYLYGAIGPFGLRLLTPIVVWVEILAVPMALLATYFGSTKGVYLAIGLVCSLHIGIAIFLRNTVLLSLVACSVFCIFLPPFGGWDTTKSDDDDDNAIILNTDKQQMTDVRVSKNDENKKQQRGDRRFSNKTWWQKMKYVSGSNVLLLSFVVGCLWLELYSEECHQSVQHIWSTLLHNRWNVFVGSEEYVTWEIAPGRLANGSIVDVWGRSDTVDWRLPGSGAPCTSTARPGRWRSFPYLAGIDGEEGDVLWGYLCKEWNTDHPSPEAQLVEFNFFMLQADVLPNMGFSATRKRLIRSFKCENKVDEGDDDDDDDERSNATREGGDDEL